MICPSQTSLSSTIEKSRKKKTAVLVEKEFAQAMFFIQVIIIININIDVTNRSYMLHFESLRVKITCTDGAIKL